MLSIFSVFSMFSKLTPRAPIQDGRMERLLHPWAMSQAIECFSSVRSNIDLFGLNPIFPKFVQDFWLIYKRVQKILCSPMYRGVQKICKSAKHFVLSYVQRSAKDL